MTATRQVEKYAVKLELPEARRYFQTIADRLTNPESEMHVYPFTGADGQRLQVLLDRLEEVDGTTKWNHD